MTREDFEARAGALRPKLLAAARRRLPHAECEDAVQSALLCAWAHLPQLRNDAAFDGWLMRILINQCKTANRARRRVPVCTDEPAAAAPEDTGLSEALETLDGEERRLLLLHHQQGYSLRELSEMTGKPEDALKMKLFRTRRKLRLALISLLVLLLLAAAAIGAQHLGVNWFLQHRTASNPPLFKADDRSECSVSYSGRLLAAQAGDAVWDRDTLSLLFTCSLAGTEPEALTVHSGHIGVDGERFDCIWIGGDILPVAEWAQGRPVYVYATDGWQTGGLFLTGSEDFLADGLGESFFAKLQLACLTPQQYEALLDGDGMLPLSCGVTVKDFASGEILETATLTLRVSAPTSEAWRELYEAYTRRPFLYPAAALPRRAGGG